MEDNYADTFDNLLGTLPGVQHLEVDPSVKPVVMANRRIPISIRPELKTELERLVEKGVITRVVARSSSKEKKQGPGICVEPPKLNKALRREQCTPPVLEVVLN